ncbi:stage VI sporulation protein D [Bacillus sp. MUM 116]|uniref:stage VI sporulation protein D n=1 Tax=Bacillus sp. MUM 116 TaxID=1678002 RepID=UPI0008F5B7BB|nr:stage VI sporulation protein D [Bacillus sp. MUM 116]OIK16953.1 stage VI sporulation protein D [Bacillus sp. MUM 116]
MSQENQSSLRFSLEESLWFRKGQEVEELVSISLDPDITIQENDQYVTIRGSLELTGEYKSFEEIDTSEQEQAASQKYVERVNEQDEGVCQFSHRFPVDITIPNNRIQSIYDIDVLVESFDYSLPERSCLKLSAELTISGLYGNEEQLEAQMEEQEPELEVLHRSQYENDEDEEIFQQPVQANPFAEPFLFEAEARKPREEEKKEAFLQFPNFSYQSQDYEPVEPYQPSWNFQESRSEGNHPFEVVEEIAEIAEIHAENDHFEEDVTIAEESSSSSEQAPKQGKKKKAAKKKSMTLTEFFARKEDGAEQAKLKVCIVQKGETVESLADRYDVTVQNLLRVNNLELNQEVYEGQVLYIPVGLAKKY